MKMRILTVCCGLFLLLAPAFAQTIGHESVTAVSGESWLHHLHRPFGETSMGKTWRLGPASDQEGQTYSSSSSEQSASRSQTLTLHGSDLYRLNCQGCHGESGQGAPPEIASLIDPVRATSAALVAQRMAKIGMTMSRRETSEMANQSQAALMKRLHQGGQDMPSFQQLGEQEIASLVAYLRLLAGIPGAEHQQTAIQETNSRIGELIVKSTCHTCHDATGVNPSPADLLEGSIPPLSALPERVNQQQLIRKVTLGAPVMGTTASPYRGRMPVFNYLRAEEASAVYAYLKRYPPEANTAAKPTLVASTVAPAAPQAYRSDTQPVDRLPDPPSAPDPFSRIQPTTLLLGSASFAFVLLSLGSCITFREFRKLAAGNRMTAATRDAMLSKTHWATVEVLLETPDARGESAAAEPSSWMEERKIS